MNSSDQSLDFRAYDSNLILHDNLMAHPLIFVELLTLVEHSFQLATAACDDLCFGLWLK